MGKDRRRNVEDDKDDNTSLKRLAKHLRGIKPPQRNHYHEHKPKQRDKSLKDIANDYNRTRDLDEVE